MPAPLHTPAVAGPPSPLASDRTGPGGPGTPNPEAASRAQPTTPGLPSSLPAPRIGSPVVSATTYAYDRLYRLTAEDGPAGDITYTYDPVGNRLTKAQNNVTTAYNHDRADRITSAGGVAYVSDANGNLIGRGPDLLTYDQANRLIQAVIGSTNAAYTYDGDGKRATKSVNGIPKSLLYDIKASVPKLLDDGERRYIWRPTLAHAIGAATNDLVHVYHTDGIDSARVLTDSGGRVTDVKRSDAFGVLVGHQGPSTQPFGFAGEQRDNETGLTYLRAR